MKLSDFKMSAAENFIGATVSYVDGTVTNSDKTVTHVVVEVPSKTTPASSPSAMNCPCRSSEITVLTRSPST